jgi:adenylosuccinate lyase
MVTALSGNQWYEGDVSCSVVRRVSIPDAFFTLDGIFQTTATILKGMEVFEEAIRQEVEENLPLVATTKLLMAAVNAGMGREDAHRKIQEVSQSSLTRRKVGEKSDFLLALSEDVDFPLTSSDIERVLATLKRDCVAADQISAIQRRISAAIQSSTERENYFEEII